MLKVKKRDGRINNFTQEKIIIAIESAMNSPNGIYKKNQAAEIASEIESEYEKSVSENDQLLSVEDIESKVFYKLCEKNNIATAKAYESYRAIHEFKRNENTSDKNILNIVNLRDKSILDENSNKNVKISSTQRDLIAGEVSKDLVKRYILPEELIEAHENGVIHIHDLDYMLQPMINCCLVDMKDILENGTVINGKKIDSPKSFQVACNIMTQVIAHVSSNQYGGQSVDISCLSKFLRKTKEDILNSMNSIIEDPDQAKKAADYMIEKQLKAGVQTIQYQINTLNNWGLVA